MASNNSWKQCFSAITSVNSAIEVFERDVPYIYVLFYIYFTLLTVSAMSRTACILVP